MSDVTFAVFRSVEDLHVQMDDKNKVILCNGKHLLIKLQKEYFDDIRKKVCENKILICRYRLDNP